MADSFNIPHEFTPEVGEPVELKGAPRGLRPGMIVDRIETVIIAHVSWNEGSAVRRLTIPLSELELAYVDREAHR